MKILTKINLSIFFCLLGILSLVAQPVSDGNGVSAHNNPNAASITISTLSVPANSDRLVVACVIGANVTSITHDGVAMTLASSASHTSGFKGYLYYRTLGTSASANTGNIVVSGSTITTATASSFHNVDQVTPIDGTTSTAPALGTITGSTLSVSSEANDLVCDCFGYFDIFGDHNVTASVGAGQTEIVNNSSGDFDAIGALSHEAGAATVSMDWTISPNTTHPTANHGTVHIAMNINKASLLPVELTYFTAKTEPDAIILGWQTASEENNEGFEVQRSLDGKAFKTLDFVKGHGTTLEVQNYQFNDREVSPNQTYYYRLKQIDFDGQFEYSPIITARIDTEGSDFTIQPNPAKNVFNIDFGALKGNSIVKVYDNSGKLVLNEQRVADGVQTFEVSSWNRGIYFVHVSNGETSSYQKLLIE